MSFIRKNKTQRLGKFKALLSYGKFFLKDKEYEKCLNTSIKSYYRFLAKNLLELNGLDFLRFHRSELKKLGHKLSWFNLSFALMMEMLNTRDVVKKIVRKNRDEISDRF